MPRLKAEEREVDWEVLWENLAADPVHASRNSLEKELAG